MFSFTLHTEFIITSFRFLSFSCIIFVVLGSVSIDRFPSWSCVLFSLVLLLDAGLCVFYVVVDFVVFFSTSVGLEQNIITEVKFV